MTDQEFETLLRRGYETGGVEFKGPGKRTDRTFLANVAARAWEWPIVATADT